jgi:hypothetical protein
LNEWLLRVDCEEKEVDRGGFIHPLFYYLTLIKHI